MKANFHSLICYGCVMSDPQKRPLFSTKYVVFFGILVASILYVLLTR